MKKDRDCNCNPGMVPYPIYPDYMPNMQMPMITPNMNVMQTPNMMMQPISTTSTGNNLSQGGTLEQQVYNLNNQVNSLERRVASLEGLVGNNNTQYNTSNYQIM